MARTWYPLLDDARTYAALFEIRHAMEAVSGAYQEPVYFRFFVDLVAGR
jgi:hypothetical protein